MEKRTLIYKNRYVDSVSLMSLGSKVKKEEGIIEAVVAMATDMNKEILALVGLATDESTDASANDLLIAVVAEELSQLEAAFELIESSLASSGGKTKGKDSSKVYRQIEQVIEDDIKPTVAIISIPGKYAARETKKALKYGMDVLIFSDNMTIEEEVEVKTLAAHQHQLVMGPDCGTAVIGGVGLCFANEVTRGDIGIVAASGTGAQEVMVQIDRLGGGITDVIGTGGRDLHISVGGLMMLEGLRRLEEDEQTKVIVCVSKPPANEVKNKILQRVKQINKPVVICFLGNKEVVTDEGNIHYASSLFEAAKIAVELSTNQSIEVKHEDQDLTLYEEVKGKYAVGLYCGGTLCYEALDQLGKNFEVKSNLGHGEQEYQKNDESVHILLDLGDDEYTNGRPHPMIEPTLRNDKILEYAQRNEVGVVLLDFELGYGSHNDPVGETILTIMEAKKLAANNQRTLAFVGYVCGTNKDKQGYERSVNALKSAGVLVAKSNLEACQLVSSLVGGSTHE